MEDLYQKQLLREFEKAWMDFRERVVLLEESPVKKKLLFNIDKYIDWYPLSDLVSLQNTLDIFSFFVSTLGKAELIRDVERIRGLLDALCHTLTFGEETVP